MVLEVTGLSKHFGGLKAVDKVDLSVRRGSVHALIGPNGSGKTTTLNMLSGLYKTTSERSCWTAPMSPTCLRINALRPGSAALFRISGCSGR
jgi:ABC-type branched-subunit amino acid transport system ATPase component